MEDSRLLKEFLEHYKKYVTSVLQPTRVELKCLLKQWKHPDYWGKYTKQSRLPNPSPIQRVLTRIKRPESVVDKIARRPGDYPKGLSPESFPRIHDAIGARAIVYFMSHLPLVDLELRNMEEIEISDDYPPVAYLGENYTRRLSLTHLKRLEKESGYTSIHYIIRLRKSEVPYKDRPWVELQVRTLAEDVWGEIEHVLGYKPDKRTFFAVKRQFQILSKQLGTIDEHFNFLYEELLRFQEEVEFGDSDPLNAENLPPVLAELGLGCAQREIDGILKLLFSRGIGTVGDLRRIATPKRIDLIRNTYRIEKGRAPINFEVAANLATMGDVVEDEKARELIKAQIAYLDAWDILKMGFV